MSVKVRWVKPVHPSVWQRPGVPLQTTDLIPDWVSHIVVALCMVNISFQMDFVWVLPGRLDEEKLCDALAQNIRDYYYGNNSE